MGGLGALARDGWGDGAGRAGCVVVVVGFFSTGAARGEWGKRGAGKVYR